ncbi:hypothetical protein [Ancylobacter sp. FA202]|uniref:hypothetical protein n=1 Tax=Ancylobacter sp. FA202 TaxID=1111106 RepID=UPI0003725A04|nr:hypothetical protein [Ancylobacter sp. FA202]
MGHWRRLGVSCGWILGLGCWLSAGVAFADRVKVRIITRTNDNVAVNVVIERRKNGDAWAKANAAARGVGIYEVLEDVCNDSIEYRAISTTSFIEQVPIREVKCKYPEIVFADFYVTSAANLIERFSDKAAWVQALGGVENAEGYATAYSDKVKEALTAADYGKIAILGSEIATQLRGTGKAQDAEIFAALSVAATARGVASRKSPDVDTTRVLVFDPRANRVVLSQEGKAFVQDYQTENLGFAASDSRFGKADWKTMRSLGGGQDVLAAEVRLPEAALSGFTAGAFLSGSP